jgi:hypothetical protein
VESRRSRATFCHDIDARPYRFDPRSTKMTARDERVVWSVPGAAADPVGNANRILNVASGFELW